LSIALSPDGSHLATVPTQTTTRSLIIVPTTAGNFTGATTISTRDCTTANIAEPRWTAHGLYALHFCGNSRVDLIAVDAQHGSSAQIQQLHSGAITAYTPIPGPRTDRFAIADQTQNPPTQPVAIYDPSTSWSHRPVAGIDGLQEVTSE
jgi:hypothetical protein